NYKLEVRSRRIITMLTDLNYEEADVLIKKAKGRLKTALVMHYLDCNREDAEKQIAHQKGRIQDVIPTH
ncbi:N-acetylmuramic acid 6-phosphate etherase, partial [bacterium]|nr:N-acetylmuramic acid 6-phosphate etherase [bacterium]